MVDCWYLCYDHYDDYWDAKSFFFRRRDFLKQYVDFDIPLDSHRFNGESTKYSLTDKGRNLVELINYFKQYYRSFKLEECIECELDSEDGCLAKRFDECPLIKLGNHLHFIPEDV